MSKVKGGEDVPLSQPLRMRLVQKGLASAELVVWAMSRPSGERFIDIRLWFSKEIDGQWMPSKKGVRVPAEELPALQKFLNAKSGELLLTHTATRELRARWIQDNSGRAFDLRYFVKTASYNGWDKRGVRVREEDCQTLNTQLSAANGSINMVGSLETEQRSHRQIRVAQDLFEAIFE